MSAPDITPGPWDLRAGNRWAVERQDGVGGVRGDGNEFIVAKDGQIIAYVAGGMENGNGTLLAAAPELLEALREARAWIVGEGSIVPERLVGRISAVLAKVDGQ